MNNTKSIRVLLCIAVIAGFFLTWLHGYKSFSGLDMVTTGSLWSRGASFLIRFGLLLVPILPLAILFNTLGSQSSGFMLRAGAFLVMVIYTGLVLLGLSVSLGGDMAREARMDIFNSLGIGFYISAIGSFLLIFTGGD